jgi:hypothetical protein
LDVLVPNDVFPYLTGDQITEVSLSRLLNHVSSGPFALVSADRGEYMGDAEKVNRRRCELEQVLKSMKLGIVRVQGHWIGNKGTPDQVDVVEQSYFIPRITRDQAFKLAEAATTRFEQESILFGVGAVGLDGETPLDPTVAPQGVFYIHKGGRVSRQFDKLTIANIKQAFARINPESKNALKARRPPKSASRDFAFTLEHFTYYPSGVIDGTNYAHKLAEVAGFPDYPYTGAPWRK